ncbi:MAG TPA: tryptophan 7-halogenase, partial [Longimicrobium sp.]|nr:tryptophan 7-halogenase [Longimicrobium sp.]
MDGDWFDVVVAGGGPAGCAAALALRAHAPGLSVALVEASAYGGERIGETLPPHAAEVLEHLGVGDAFRAQGHHPAY